MWILTDDGLSAINCDRLESMHAKAETDGETFIVTGSDWYANQHVLRTGFETLSDAAAWMKSVLARANMGEVKL